jgi:hypothetical protein
MTTSTLYSTWSIDEKQFPYGGNSECRYEFLLRYAILAPSSHNSQPWLFDITHDRLDLYADPTRALPVVDPENRELVISCGAALEYLCVSARYFGYAPSVSYHDWNDDADLLARFSFGERIQPDATDIAMFNAIPRRHTNRMKFDQEIVPQSVIEELKTFCEGEDVIFHVLNEESDRNEVARMVTEGDQIQGSDGRFRRELAAWVHANRTRSRDGMPGYAFGVGDLSSVFAPLVVRTFDWGNGQAARDQQLAMGSPLLAVLKTIGDAPSDWINTGRALARVLLWLTHHHLSASFLNQPIEVQDLRLAFGQKLGGDARPQILLRIGYGPETKPTPRRPVKEIMLNRAD